MKIFKTFHSNNQITLDLPIVQFFHKTQLFFWRHFSKAFFTAILRQLECMSNQYINMSYEHYFATCGKVRSMPLTDEQLSHARIHFSCHPDSYWYPTTHIFRKRQNQSYSRQFMFSKSSPRYNCGPENERPLVDLKSVRTLFLIWFFFWSHFLNNIWWIEMFAYLQ